MYKKCKILAIALEGWIFNYEQDRGGLTGEEESFSTQA